MLANSPVWRDEIYQRLKKVLSDEQIEDAKEYTYNDKEQSNLYGPLSDRVEELYDIEFANHIRLGYKEPSEISGSNWLSAFSYAGDGRGWSTSNSEVTISSVPPGSKVWDGPFCTGDVKSIHRLKEGEHDTDNWLIVGQLWDGRFFALRAGCDYTGWD